MFETQDSAEHRPSPERNFIFVRLSCGKCKSERSWIAFSAQSLFVRLKWTDCHLSPVGRSVWIYYKALRILSLSIS